MNSEIEQTLVNAGYKFKSYDLDVDRGDKVYLWETPRGRMLNIIVRTV